jgi:hypothetical protein
MEGQRMLRGFGEWVGGDDVLEIAAERWVGGTYSKWERTNGGETLLCFASNQQGRLLPGKIKVRLLPANDLPCCAQSPPSACISRYPDAALGCSSLSLSPLKDCLPRPNSA